MIAEHINDEQLLELCLSDQYSRDYDLEGISGELLTLYAMHQFPDPEKVTTEQVTEKLKELIASHLLRKLVAKGQIEVTFDENGQTVYKKVSNE